MPNETPAPPAPEEPPLLPGPEQPLLLAGPKAVPTLLERRPHMVIVVTLAALLFLAFAIGWFMHHRRAMAAEKANREARERTPLAIVVQAKRSAPFGEMLLPGSLMPIEEASIYARSTGYVDRRLVDIGDFVHAGQLLAHVDSPELDQQALQAAATLAQSKQQLDSAIANVADAQAKLDVARVTLGRYRVLLSQDSIARQEVDTQQQVYDSAVAALRAANANVGAAQEGVHAAEADRRRILALKGYEEVRAPFDGVITSRNIDQGALISGTGAGLVGSSTQSTSGGSGTGTSSSNSTSSSSSSGGSSESSSGSGVEMFHIAQIRELRVYVNVPQESATLIKPGSPAAVIVREADAPVIGAVTRTAHTLDPSSRTLLTEVQIPNLREQLLPGMFATVRFVDPRPSAPLMLSGEALITRAEGTSVAVLEPLTDDERRRMAKSPDARCARHVRMQPVGIGRDYGTQVEITRGLKDGEFIVLNPGDDVRQGAVLLPQLQSPQDASGQGANAGGPAKNKNSKDKDKDGKDGKKKSDDDERGDPADGADRQREHIQQACLEQQASAQASAAASQPAGREPGATAANGVPLVASAAGAGSPTDLSPTGIVSPSIQAPTQGQKSKK